MYIFVVPSNFPLTRETDSQKKLSNFAKLQFLYDKIDQNTNFVKLPSLKWLFCIGNSTFLTKFCKIAQLFLCVSFSGERKFERIETEFKTQKPDLSLFRRRTGSELRVANRG